MDSQAVARLSKGTPAGGYLTVPCPPGAQQKAPLPPDTPLPQEAPQWPLPLTPPFHLPPRVLAVLARPFSGSSEPGAAPPSEPPEPKD